jgi:phenylpropionate dioxygenase-like ring-hydroxylating dioxygenase large terminal subunit
MAVIDHWHPVCSLAQLRKKPIVRKIDGREIAIFITDASEVAALDEVCPHRRMRLSEGRVVGNRLECCYHGWTFDAKGHGESPGAPKMYLQTRYYETRVEHGWVWVREAGSDTTFPNIEMEGYKRIGELEYDFPFPVEIVLDNFAEAEHTGPVHEFFGFPTERMHEVEVKLDVHPDRVRVVYYGPHKQFSWLYRTLVGVSKNAYMNDDWTTYFSPLHTFYEFQYIDPQTKKIGRLHQRVLFFFIPESADQTRVIIFLYFKYDWWGTPYFGFLFYPLMRHRLNAEIIRDKEIIGKLADLNPSLEGMKLSRFDRVLGLNRERIERIYRGNRRTELPTLQNGHSVMANGIK